MQYSSLIIPLVVAALAQVVKLSVDKVRGNLNLKNIWLSYGGMPSAHTAFAVSVATIAGLYEGWDSPLFAVAAVFTLIIMRDAVTFRNYMGQQGRLFNALIEKLPPTDRPGLPHFMERVGHTVGEVVSGVIFGVVLTLLLNELSWRF